MAEISGFHNSVNGDRRVKADFFARFFGSLIGNGVFPNPSTGLQVIANGDMTVTVKAGKGWVNGVFYENTSDKIITLDVADGVLKRIDRIVLRYTALDREIKAVVKKGAFAGTPVASVLQRDADIWELGIADIYVGVGITSISQANITDLRLNSSYCGVVTGLIEQVDGETLFVQYQELRNEEQADFLTWFNTMKGQLGTDAAGNLQNQIDSISGAGRTNETVKGNADIIAGISSELTYKKIITLVTTSDLAKIDLSNIPPKYRYLKLIISDINKTYGTANYSDLKIDLNDVSMPTLTSFMSRVGAKKHAYLELINLNDTTLKYYNYYGYPNFITSSLSLGKITKITLKPSVDLIASGAKLELWGCE